MWCMASVRHENIKRTAPAVRWRWHTAIFFKVLHRNGERQSVTGQHAPQPPIPQEEVTEKGFVDCSPHSPQKKTPNHPTKLRFFPKLTSLTKLKFVLSITTSNNPDTGHRLQRPIQLFQLSSAFHGCKTVPKHDLEFTPKTSWDKMVTSSFSVLHRR